ncbi:MAG TPA: class I SAM-dependent methyltransferase, partial [Mangrovimonas sp.]|nr:class I SAM-dependent methyltransferase [Mangrovimonas sp.]
MLQVVKTYLKFLLKSTNQHGVHSPFVFELVTKCFYDKKKYTEYNLLKNHRKKLLENKQSIEITDFGAGSKIFKSNLRAINKMAENSGISPKRSRLLFRLVKYFKPSNILELGTHL